MKPNTEADTTVAIGNGIKTASTATSSALGISAMIPKAGGPNPHWGEPSPRLGSAGTSEARPQAEQKPDWEGSSVPQRVQYERMVSGRQGIREQLSTISIDHSDRCICHCWRVTR